jgi:hypothetical protein
MASSGGFDDFAGLEAAGADADALGAARDYGANGLKIRVEAAVSAIVGVADLMTELRPFAAHFTALGHCCTPPTRILL